MIYRKFRNIVSFIVILILYPAITVCSQFADSLENEIEQAEGNKKIFLLNQLAEEYLSDSPDKSIHYSKKALEISETSNNNDVIQANYIIGKAYTKKSDYENARKYFDIALKIAEKLNDKKQIANLLIEFGDLYGKISNYEKALENFLQALKLNKEIDNQQGIAESYHHIAIIYYYIINFEKALDYNKQALKIYQNLNIKEGIAKSTVSIAMVYIGIDSIDKALEYNFKALDILKEIGNSTGIAIAYYNISLAYINIQDYDKAIKYSEKALELFNPKFDFRNISLVLSNIGRIYLETKRYSKALEYIDKGYDFAIKSNNIDLLAAIYYDYSDVYFKLEDYKSSLNYKNSYNNIKDSIFNEESRNKISELEVEIETELLKQTNQQQFIFFIVITALIIIIAFVLYGRFRIKKNANKLLEDRNKKISEQNETLEQLNNELNDANAAKDKFLGIMAHDLKSPLWWSKNITDMLSKKHDQLSREKIKEIAQVLDDSAQTSLHLIENLLQWSRSQTGSIEFIPESLNLNSIINQIIKHHELHTKAKNISVVSHISDKFQVKADKNMLLTILRNILSNAIKFTQEGGEVKIGCNDYDDRTEIFVQDNGIGMSIDDIQKVFKIESRHTTIGTSQEKGTGLGLIVTKEFIKKHDGEIEISSKLNEGTKVLFTISKK